MNIYKTIVTLLTVIVIGLIAIQILYNNAEIKISDEYLGIPTYPKQIKNTKNTKNTNE